MTKIGIPGIAHYYETDYATVRLTPAEGDLLAIAMEHGRSRLWSPIRKQAARLERQITARAKRRWEAGR